MRAVNPLSVPSPEGSKKADRNPSSLARETERLPNADPSTRPFVERRHLPPNEQSWQDALDCLQRHLLAFEIGNEQLKESEDEYHAIFEDAPIGLFQISPEGRPLRINRSMARIFGYESPEQLLADVSSREPSVLIDPSQWIEWKTSTEGEVRCGIEKEIGCPNGDKKWVRLNVRTVKDGSLITRFEGTGEDITERKRIEVRNHFLAYHDQLTGLPNRTLFKKRLEQVIAAAKWKKHGAALLLLEIERFKIINDSLGDLFGDRLLKEIADRIKAGASKQSIVARVAGAEFAVILPEVDDFRQASAIAESVVSKLSVDFTFLGHSLNVFFHLGISMFPENGEDGETLIKRADVAMCSAREEGSNNLRFFTEEMNSQMLERLRLENGLRLALTKCELFLLYQPQVDIRTGAVTGLEALLRWQHPQLGLISPTKFIGVAESTGLIVPIGEWVLRTACSQARKWQDEGLPAVPVAVNVSALQFRQQGFRELIRSVLQDTGLDPKYLELELTESLLLTNADVMFSIIQELKGMGVKLAIDDFGSGYSSLGYLRQFKANRLKISRSFVQDIPANSDDAVITMAIIRMAKALNLSVIAEGVENEAQLSFLRAQQCYTIQGFYFSKPVAGQQIVKFLRDGFIQSASAANG